jgi:hypothetical protein
LDANLAVAALPTTNPLPEAKLLAAAVRGAFLGALVCGQGALAAEGSEQVPRFEPAPCPKLQGAEELAKASCGYLFVPENRSLPAGRTIRLMVAKYHASSAEKRPDPVVYLAGRPGDIAPRSVVLDSVLPTTYNVAANWQNASDGFGNIFRTDRV